MKNYRHLLSNIIILTAMLSMAAYLLLFNLGKEPFRIWDESRMAANSIEMYRDGYSLIPTYESKPDMWNTKPPLLIWMQTTSIHIFGVSEWSVRLPSALAALVLVIMIYICLKRFTGNSLISATAALIPVTSAGYLLWHNCRSGDYDSLLTLMIFIYAISFFLFVQYKSKKYLYLTFMFFTLAVLVKSTAALLPVLGLIIYAITQKQIFNILRLRHFWISASIMIIVIAGYYLGREVVNPGYLNAVNENEITGRFFEVKEGHVGGSMFYLKLLFTDRFSFWIWFLIPAIPLSLVNSSQLCRKAALFSIIMWSAYLLVISISKTKLSWYDVPAYPFFALTIGLAINGLVILLKKQVINRHSLYVNKIISLLFVCSLLFPWFSMASRVKSLEEPPWDKELYHIQYLIKDAVKGDIDLSGFYLLNDDLYQRVSFYRTHYELKGEQLKVINEEQIIPGDKLIVYNPIVYEKLTEKYLVTEIINTKYPTVKMISVDGLKAHND